MSLLSLCSDGSSAVFQGTLRLRHRSSLSFNTAGGLWVVRRLHTGMEPTDFNALAFDQNSTRDPLQKHFIPREGSRKRGLEIEFDSTRHSQPHTRTRQLWFREWVTGFRKRKAERKTAARKGLEIRAKEERLEDRKKRFEEKKKNLNLPDDYGVGDLNEDEHAAPETVAHQTTHRQAGITTVVTTSAIAYDSDEDQNEEYSTSGSEDGQHQPLAVLAPASADRPTPVSSAHPGVGAAGSPVDDKGRKPKKRQSSADRLAKLKMAQGKKSKQRGPRAPRKAKGSKGKTGKGKRS